MKETLWHACHPAGLQIRQNLGPGLAAGKRSRCVYYTGLATHDLISQTGFASRALNISRAHNTGRAQQGPQPMRVPGE